MWRAIGVAAIVIALVACGAGLWAARSSAIAPLILPGATGVVVTSQGINSIRVEYHTAGRPFEWRVLLDQQLVRTGWRGREYNFTGTRFPFVVTWYVREAHLGPFTLAEHAVVGGDPDDPTVTQIQIHHELHFND